MASQQTSGVLASAIIVRARAYLNEATESFWLDTELLAWLNDGSMDIVVRTHCLENIETEQLVANQLAYPITENYILIKGVVYNKGSGNEKGLIRGNLQKIGHVRGTEPIYWIQHEDSVFVYPKPDTDHSGVGHDLDIYTVSRPASVASGAAVLTPAYYDRALTLYIAAQGFYKDSQFTKAGRLMAEYLAELDRYRTDFVTVPKESAEVVK